MTVISFVIPVKDEDASLVELTEQIFDSVAKIGKEFRTELILIDDGSQDQSWNIMQELAQGFPGKVKALRFRRNLGKSLALEAGFRECTGEFVFTMDADLQDDPKEIPRFLDKMYQGFDLVSGWKFNRHDPLSKTLPSKLFNRVTAWVTGVKLNDFNCGFKCYRREVIKNIHLYGELHRYIPVLAADLGYRVGEIEVEHHPRVHGRSKYGWERYIRGFIDLLTVLATTRWLAKPGHLFGSFGVGLGLIGGTCLTYLFFVWLFGTTPIGSRPLLAFGVLTTLASLQMISLGVIAEFYVKNTLIDTDKYVSSRLGSDHAVTDESGAQEKSCLLKKE